MGEFVEMFALMVCATIGSRSVTVRTGVSWTRRLAQWMSGRAASGARDAGEIAARAERLSTIADVDVVFYGGDSLCGATTTSSILTSTPIAAGSRA